MRGQFRNSPISLMITLLCLGSLLSTLIWNIIDNNDDVDLRQPKTIKLCKGCREVIDKVLTVYSQSWKKQEDNYQKFRAKLNSQCHGRENAIITQINTPLGSKTIIAGKTKWILEVTPEILSAFPKVSPFLNKKWETCSVVGNGGILADSGCGKDIDSAEFVMRCNLPPLTDGFEKHVGVKTNLVTANPSIFLLKYGSLMGRRRAFVERLKPYGDSLLLLPFFSHNFDAQQCIRAAYTLEDFGSPIQPVFLNSEYYQNVTSFWKSQGLQAARPSTGILMASLAIELCKNVHLYGFWPFGSHPFELYSLSNHYYDNSKVTSVHAMPAEFEFLMQLHIDGVIKLHLEDCRPGKK